MAAIDQDELISKLEQKGYDAILENGIVIVFYNKAEEMIEYLAKLKTIFQEYEYTGSFGLRGRNAGKCKKSKPENFNLHSDQDAEEANPDL